MILYIYIYLYIYFKYIVFTKTSQDVLLHRSYKFDKDLLCHTWNSYMYDTPEINFYNCNIFNQKIFLNYDLKL